MSGSFDDNLEDAIANSLERLGKLGVEEARNTQRFQSGQTFKDQIIFQKLDKTSGLVVSGAKHSFWLEEGNNQKGDKIYPVHSKVLVFFWHGELQFRKWVRSHGAYNFMRNASEVVESKGA